MKKALLALSLATAVHTPLLHAAEAAWLYQEISPQAYVRLPQQWTLLLADGSRDQAALLPHWQAVQDKLALLPGQSKDLSAAQKTALDEFLRHNRGALEMALYVDEGAPLVLLGAQSDYEADKDFLVFVEAFAQANGAQHNGDGKAGVVTNLGKAGMQAAYRFDAATGRHQWLISDVLPQDIDFNKFFVGGDASLQAASAQIDPQGQGLLFWVRNNPILLNAASGDNAWVKALQLLKLKSLSAGYGVAANGKPAWQLNAEIAPGGLRDFFPTQAMSRDIAVYGDLEAAYGFTVPDAQGMRQIVHVIEQGSGESNLYAQMKEAWQRDLKIDVDVLFDGLSGQWTVIYDAFGTVFAVRKQDGFDKLIALLQENGYLTLQEVGDSGVMHGRLSFMHLLNQDNDIKQEMEENPLLAAILQAPSHFYYREEGDYRLFASLPQPLQDRARTKGGQALGTFAGNMQATPTSLFALVQAEQLARRHYYSRLEWLQYLADIGGVEIDMASLPSAHMLDLPEKSYLSAAIVSDAENLRLQVGFEHSALDIFSQQGVYSSMTGIAVIGIISAIALPAYQDYVERAHEAQLEAESKAQAARALAEMGDAGKAEITQLIGDIYDKTADLRASVDKGEEIQDVAVSKLLQDIPAIANISLEEGLYIDFSEQAPAYLQQSLLILWPEQDAHGKDIWSCYLDDPNSLGDVLMPSLCNPYVAE